MATVISETANTSKSVFKDSKKSDADLSVESMKTNQKLVIFLFQYIKPKAPYI